MDTDDRDAESVAADLASAWPVSRLAKALHVSHRTALRIATTRLRHYRVGRDVRIADSVARAYIRSLAREPAPEPEAQTA